MNQEKEYVLVTIHLINGDHVDAVQDVYCPLTDQIIYQFEHQKREYITIKQDSIGIASIPTQSIVYITANYMTMDELDEYFSENPYR